MKISDQLYFITLKELDEIHQGMLACIPLPSRVKVGEQNEDRFTEQTIPQVIIQKLARITSGLRAAELLLKSGFLQELAVMQRVLDELTEDVFFLALASNDEAKPNFLQRYLDAFWEEELDRNGKQFRLGKNRYMVPRKKIRAYLANHPIGANTNPSGSITNSQSISKAYSGYLHAASPQIMEMYDASPPRFRTNGMLESQYFQDHEQDIWNNLFRGVGSFLVVVNLMGDEHFKTKTKKLHDIIKPIVT